MQYKSGSNRSINFKIDLYHKVAILSPRRTKSFVFAKDFARLKAGFHIIADDRKDSCFRIIADDRERSQSRLLPAFRSAEVSNLQALYAGGKIASKQHGRR